jgi:hypothetical protein
MQNKPSHQAVTPPPSLPSFPAGTHLQSQSPFQKQPVQSSLLSKLKPTRALFLSHLLNPCQIHSSACISIHHHGFNQQSNSINPSHPKQLPHQINKPPLHTEPTSPYHITSLPVPSAFIAEATSWPHPSTSSPPYIISARPQFTTQTINLLRQQAQPWHHFTSVATSPWLSAIHFIHHPKPELSFAMANHCAQLLPIITVNKQAA